MVGGGVLAPLPRPQVDADLFDPETIAAVADFANPYRYPEGIEWVVVNGEIAVRNGQLMNKFAGQVIRA